MLRQCLFGCSGSWTANFIRCQMSNAFTACFDANDLVYMSVGAS
jgi:hypothetical protein